MYIRAAIFVLSVIFVTTMCWAQETHVGVVKNVTGEVAIVRDDDKILAEPGMHVMVTDKIVSKAESSGGIVFDDGTMLSIGPSSEIDIEQYVFKPNEEQYDFSLYIKKGQAVYSSGKIGKLAPEKIKVKTPRATLGVRGTSFIVAVD